MKIAITRSVMLLCTTISTCCFAATATNDITDAADAGLTSKRLAAPTTVLPSTNIPAISKPVASTTSAIPNANQIKFVLTRVNVEGATVYKPQQIEAFFTPYYHQEISLEQLQKLINDVTSFYRNNGYILSKAIIPPQKIENGIVTVRIVEGFINQVNIQGNPGRAKPLIAALGQQATQQKPTQMKNLERTILLANDIPGSSVKAVITPSTSTPGSADLNLVAEQKLAEGYFAYDNFGTRFLGPQQFSIGGNVNSLVRSGDTWAAHAAISSQTKELRFLQLAHDEPIGSNGLRWNISSMYTETQPGSILQSSEIQGRSRSVSTGLSYPLIRSRNENWLLQGSFTYMNSTTSILSEPFYDDKIRYLHLGTSYDMADHLAGIDSGSFSVEKGIGFLGASTGDDDISRPDARADFTKLIAQLSRLQAFGGRYSLLVAGQGQYAFNPLFAAQQFAYGGSDYGRGYDPSEIVGDSGVGGKTEFRIDTNPGFKYLNSIQYYAFYDLGKIWNIKDLGQPKAASAASTGLGARVTLNKYFDAEAFLAQPLTRPVADEEAVGNNGKRIRGFFQLVTLF